MKFTTVVLIMSLSIIFLGCSVFGVRSAPTPDYQVLVEDKDKQIREYDEYIVAKTTVSESNYDDAQNKAFRRLADYIFGKNKTNTEMKMTTPVTQKNNSSETLEMTAPVLQSEGENSRTMSFIMPKEYTMESLPAPKDSRIEFEKVPKRTMAAIRYTWSENKERNQKKAQELLDWLKKQPKYKQVASPVYAGYDPPWTLPFLRRNEMLIEVKK